MPYEIDGRTILVIWAPGGQARPYRAKLKLGKNDKEYGYFIRKGSSTVRAKGAKEEYLKDILANITSDQAVHILKVLWEKRRDVREIMVNEAEKLLGPVDPDEIAEDLFFALESIDVHELWDRSGSHSDGYTSPEDMAMEMVEEELDQFSDQIMRYHNLGLHEEEKLFCMGVLKGLYRFDKEAKSEFRDWASDVAGECFEFVLKNWQKQKGNERFTGEMDEFIKVTCPKWAR